MTMQSKSSSRYTTPNPNSTLDVRAELLQELLAGDGIEISLEDARDFLLAELVERMMARSLDAGIVD